MSLKKLLSLNLLLLSTVLLTACSQRQIILHPIKDTDIYFKDSGDICFSEKYFDTVLKLKIQDF